MTEREREGRREWALLYEDGTFRVIYRAPDDLTPARTPVWNVAGGAAAPGARDVPRAEAALQRHQAAYAAGEVPPPEQGEGAPDGH
jgi:hypothetical protein